MKRRVSGGIVRGINLAWTPGFADRADLIQADATLRCAMAKTLPGCPRWDFRAGMVRRRRIWVSRHASRSARRCCSVQMFSMIISLNLTWIAGLSEWRPRAASSICPATTTEALGSDTVGNNVSYSPDGWDVELSGFVPHVPWVEYSGRYYRWDRDGDSDLDGA